MGRVSSTAIMARAWLITAVMAMAAANLWPLDLHLMGLWGRAHALIFQDPDWGTLLAGACWGVCGVIAAGALGGQASSAWRRWAMAGALGAVCLGVEMAQLLVIGRHGGLIDGAFGAAAAWAGMWLGLRVVWPSERVLRFASAILALAIAAVAPATAAYAALQRPFENWDWRFPLAIGDEAAGGRAWRGEVEGVAIYPAVLNGADIARLAQLPWTPDGAAQREAHGAILVLTPADEPGVWRASPQAAETLGVAPMRLFGRDVSRTLMDVGPVIEAVRAAHAVSVELVAQTDDAVQWGQPRLVTVSPDIYQRNITIAQEGPDLMVRVRTPWSGLNGMRQGTTFWHDVLQPGRRRHIVTTYDGARVGVFADAAAAGEVSVYRPRLHLAHGRWWGDAAALGGGFLAAGLAWGAAFCDTGAKMRVLVAAALAAPVSLVMVAGEPSWLSAAFAVWAGLAALAGVGMGAHLGALDNWAERRGARMPSTDLGGLKP